MVWTSEGISGGGYALCLWYPELQCFVTVIIITMASGNEEYEHSEARNWNTVSLKMKLLRRTSLKLNQTHHYTQIWHFNLETFQAVLF